MDYAIVRISGKQYQVQEGQEVLVERLAQDAAAICDFSDVLLLRKNGTVYVGDPFVKDAVVRAQVIAQEKGKKMYVSKYKAKVNYNKTMGFRPQITRIKIDAIRYGNEPTVVEKPKTETKKAEKVAPAPASEETKPVKKAAARKPRVAKA